MMFWSPSRGTFFDNRLKPRYQAAGTWPDDAVPVDDATHAVYAQGAPSGMALGADASGRPAWVETPRFPDAAAAERALVRHIDAATAQVVGAVPEDEKVSWPVKAMAAAAFDAGTADALQTAMIEAEAAKSGETPAELATLIVSRVVRNAAIIAPLAGIRRRTAAELAAAPGAASLHPIVDAAMAEIDATIAAVLAAHPEA